MKINTICLKEGSMLHFTTASANSDISVL